MRCGGGGGGSGGELLTMKMFLRMAPFFRTVKTGILSSSWLSSYWFMVAMVGPVD